MATAKRKIKVVHVAQYLEIGGLETFVIEVCRNIDRKSFEVAVLCLNGFDEQYRLVLEENGVPLHLVTKKSRYDLAFFFRAAALLRKEKVDILHAHGGCFFYTALIGRLAGIKTVTYTAHGLPVRSGFQEDVEEFLSFFLASKVVAVSTEVAEDFKRRLRVFSPKVDVILNGVDTRRYRGEERADAVAQKRRALDLPQDAVIIGAVGRLEPVKNYSLLLNSFADLAAKSTIRVHLVLVGSGSEEEALKSLAASLGIESGVSFLGMRYDLPDIYPLFDVFVLSSLTEGTSISLLEAQACGVPAVVTDVGGNPVVIAHGVNGLVCPSGDRASLAELLARLASDDSLRLRMRRSARLQTEERFSLAAMIKRYQALYRQLAFPGVP